MCAEEFAMIMKDALDEFENWYANICKNKNGTFRALADFYEKEL